MAFKKMLRNRNGNSDLEKWIAYDRTSVGTGDNLSRCSLRKKDRGCK